MDNQNPSDTGGGNKIFMVILLMLTVFILVLLLLLALGLLPVGTKSTTSGCGDDNPCTTDSMDASGACKHEAADGPKLACSGPTGLCAVHVCSAGSCISKVIDNCCGNGKCELPETASACPIDCGGGGTLTIHGSDGNTYNEFNKNNTLCEPNTGNSDGAQCTCTENDCTDGVDNDNDGLIDCRDPDCNCLQTEGCPPCEGDCAPLSVGLRRTDAGVLSSFISFCTTNGGVMHIGTGDDTAVWCSFSSEGMSCTKVTAIAIVPRFEDLCKRAGGEYSCTDVNGAAQIICTCPGSVCESGIYPQCGGSCSTGKTCTPVAGATAAGVGECECLPEQMPTCENSLQYKCTGTCPIGQSCNYSNGQCICVRQQVTCENSYSMQCTGTCKSGEQCLRTLWNTCKCVPIECEKADAPECKGVCPNDQGCTYLGNDQCGCQEKDCEDINGDTVNECAPGVCSNDDEECLPTDSDCSCKTRCEDANSANECSDAWCPDDEVCAPYYSNNYITSVSSTEGDVVNPLLIVAPSACTCLQRCEDIAIADSWSCNFGWCDTGYCGYDPRAGVCGCVPYVD